MAYSYSAHWLGFTPPLTLVTYYVLFFLHLEDAPR
jgi:hypothetical protein